MNNNIEILELFGKYENNELSAAERNVFEQQLKNDASFKEEFEHYQLSSKLIIEAQLINLHEQIGQFHEQEVAKQSRFKTNAIIAAIILISGLIAGVYYFSSSKNEKIEPKPIENKSENTVLNNSISPSNDSVQHTDNKEVSIEKSKNTNTKTNHTLESKEIDNLLLVSTPTISTNNQSVSTPINTPAIGSQNRQSLNVNSKSFVNQQQSVKTNPCNGVNLDFEAFSKSTCGTNKDGNIAIEEVNGLNTSTYSLFVNERQALSNIYITDLDSGIYQIKIKDANGCVSATKNIKVNYTLCDIKEVLKLSINEKWTLSAGIGDKIIITDKMDKVVYQNNQLNNGENFIWAGTDNNNQELVPGIYFVNIFKNDNLVQKGSITITY